MLYYILIFLLCIAIYAIDKTANNKREKNILSIITISVLAVFSGTRYRIGGWDYGIYERIFEWAPMLSKFNLSCTNAYGTEVGYIALNSIVKTIGINFYGFTLIHSVIFYVLLYRALKKFDIDISFFIVVFLYKSCIFNTFVSMRQSLVTVIFLNALYYLINGKKIKYILYILPCLLLHSSAIILLPLVFIKKLKFSRKSMIIYGVIFFVFFILNITNIYKFNPENIISKLFGNNINIMSKSEGYLSNEKDINVFSTIETYVVWLLIIMLYKKMYQKSSDEMRVFVNLYLMIIPIVTLCRSYEVMIRLRDYFSFFFPFVMYYIKQCLEDKNTREIYTLIVFILCFVGYYRYIYTYDTGEYAMKRYQTYLTKDISIIKER